MKAWNLAGQTSSVLYSAQGWISSSLSPRLRKTELPGGEALPVRSSGSTVAGGRLLGGLRGRTSDDSGQPHHTAYLQTAAGSPDP